ncbi:hypothetical protein M2137_001475 [Parabacteroides sp. PFB2-10]|uniref:hypothetical protein n=1 Tax=Parabacteroides sp. PFB2-10 TaxID=1742405 RepID=UPI002475FB71|nr:hypothetical protein [Parabacteroides sp. PFB2-10]MDH6312700.1 hypothetical protein [Parabacteroides sp. PFB2-10]
MKALFIATLILLSSCEFREFKSKKTPQIADELIESCGFHYSIVRDNKGRAIRLLNDDNVIASVSYEKKQFSINYGYSVGDSETTYKVSGILNKDGYIDSAKEYRCRNSVFEEEHSYKFTYNDGFLREAFIETPECTYYYKFYYLSNKITIDYSSHCTGSIGTGKYYVIPLTNEPNTNGVIDVLSKEITCFDGIAYFLGILGKPIPYLPPYKEIKRDSKGRILVTEQEVSPGIIYYCDYIYKD